MGRDSFVFRQSYYNALAKVRSDSDFRECVNAICNYAFEGAEPAADAPDYVGIILDLVRPSIDAAAARYAACIENGKKGGKYGTRGGRPQKPQSKPQSKPLTVTDTVTDTVADAGKKEKSTNVDEKKTAKRFIVPSLDDVKAYIQEKGYTVDAGRFVDYYTSKGWKVGTSPMKDWRAAVNGWQRREADQKTNGTQTNQPRTVDVCGVSVTLGAGEYIDNAGRRTYGSGRATIPNNAPARPSERYSWNASNQQWILI